MSNEEIVYGMPKLTTPGSNCQGFLMAKQVRKAFPRQTSFNAKCVLELIHVDICGLIQLTTPAGNRYFFHLFDDLVVKCGFIC